MPDKPKPVENQASTQQKVQHPEKEKIERLLSGLELDMVVVYCGPSELGLLQYLGSKVGPKGRIIIIDNEHSVADMVRSKLEPLPQYVITDKNIDSYKESESFSDFTLSLFSLEYARHPDQVFENLERLTRPGGRLVVGETDNPHLNHYPMADHLVKNWQEIANACSERGIWHPDMGRKLFQYFNESDFREIRADLIPHRLLCGHADWDDAQEWRDRLERVDEAHANGRVDLSFDFKAFRREFSNFFENPNRFSYSPLILVEAIRGA